MGVSETDVAEKFVGPLLVGTLFNVALFGMCLMQAHTYYQNCTNDAKWIKWMVGWLIIMEATSSGLASFVAFDYAVRDFGNANKVLIRTPEFSAFLLSIGINSTTTQAFYAWRIKRFLKKDWLGYLIWVAAVAQLLCITGVAAGDSIVTSFLEFQRAKPIRVLVIFWMTLAASTDLFIAGLLVWFLRKSRTGFKKTDAMLNKLALLTVQTGAITALFALVGLLMFLTIPDFVHLIFIFTLPEFYGVCLMSSLNARSQWQNDLSGSQSYSARISGKGDTSTSTSRAGGVVHITTSVVTHSDNLELATTTSTSPLTLRKEDARDRDRGIYDLNRGAIPDRRHSNNVEEDFKKARIYDDDDGYFIGNPPIGDEKATTDDDIETGRARVVAFEHVRSPTTTTKPAAQPQHRV